MKAKVNILAKPLSSVCYSPIPLSAHPMGLSQASHRRGESAPLKRLMLELWINVSKAAHDSSCTQSSSRLNVGHVVVNNSGEFAPTTFWRYPRRDVTNSVHILILVGKVYSTSTCASLCCFPYFGWPMSHLSDGTLATPQLSSSKELGFVPDICSFSVSFNLCAFILFACARVTTRASP